MLTPMSFIQLTCYIIRDINSYLFMRIIFTNGQPLHNFVIYVGYIIILYYIISILGEFDLAKLKIEEITGIYEELLHTHNTLLKKNEKLEQGMVTLTLILQPSTGSPRVFKVFKSL